MSKRKVRKAESAAQAREAAGPSSAIPWRPIGIAVGLIALAVIATYTNTLWMGIVFNDPLTFTDLKFTDAASFFTQCWLDMVYRPLMQPWCRASFGMDILNYQQQFGWYHLVNLFLHLSSCVALFFLVLRLARRWVAQNKTGIEPVVLAGLSALIFAVHPMAAESATYISARYAPLGTSNFLIALNFFLMALLAKGLTSRIWGYVLFAAFFLMSLASSLVGLALPATCILLVFLLKPPAVSAKNWAIDHPFVLGALFILTVLIPFYLVNGFHPAGAPNWYAFPKLSPPAYYATQAKAFATYYTRCAVVPLGLSLDPPFAQTQTWSDIFAIFGAIMLIALAVATKWIIRNPVYSFGVLLVWAGLLPAFLIVQTERVADPVIYLALGGFSVVVACFLLQLWQGSLKANAPKYGAVLAVLLGLAVLRNCDFSSDDRLIASTLRTNPHSAQALSYSAMNRLKSKDYDKALSEADQALAADPELVLAYYAKGNALLGLKRYSDAEAALDKAQTMADEKKLPILGPIRLSLAEAYMKEEKPELIGPLVFQAMLQDPNNPRAIYLIGMANLQRKGYGQAYMYLKKAAEAGVLDALQPLAEASLKLEHYQDAMLAADAAVRYQDSPEAELALGNAAIAVNQLGLAEKALTKASKAQPDNAEALALLSVYYDKKGDKVLAESYHKDAVKRDPEIFSTLSLPGYVQKGEPAKTEAAPAATKRRRRGR